MREFIALRGWPRWSSIVVGFALATVSAAAQAADPIPVSSTSASTPLTVYLDQAAVMKLTDRTHTLVVGNPVIADASAQPGGVLVITGKSYGATNLVAVDRNGAVLMERTIQVQGPSDITVVVYRGIDRETYSCVPVCERRITL